MIESDAATNRASIDSGILGWIFPSLRDSSWGLEGRKHLPSGFLFGTGNSPFPRPQSGDGMRDGRIVSRRPLFIIGGGGGGATHRESQYDGWILHTSKHLFKNITYCTPDMLSTFVLEAP